MLWGGTLCCGLGATRQPPARRRRHQPWPSAGNTQNRQHGRTSQRSTESAHGLGLVRLEVTLLARPIPRRGAAGGLAVGRRVEELLADRDAGLNRRRRRRVRPCPHHHRGCLNAHGAQMLSEVWGKYGSARRRDNVDASPDRTAASHETASPRAIWTADGVAQQVAAGP